MIYERSSSVICIQLRLATFVIKYLLADKPVLIIIKNLNILKKSSCIALFWIPYIFLTSLCIPHIARYAEGTLVLRVKILSLQNSEALRVEWRRLTPLFASTSERMKKWKRPTSASSAPEPLRPSKYFNKFLETR